MAPPVELVAPFSPESRRGRPSFSVEDMLRIHFMQQGFTLTDPEMEDALHAMPRFRDFAGLGGWSDGCPPRRGSRVSAICWRCTRWRRRSCIVGPATPREPAWMLAFRDESRS